MLKITKKVEKKPRKLTPFNDLTIDYMLDYAYKKLRVKKQNRIYSQDIYIKNKKEREKLITQLCEDLHIDWFVFEVLMDNKLKKDEWLFEFLFDEMIYESAFYTESLHKHFETAYDRMLDVINERKKNGELDGFCSWKINVIRVQD